MIEAFQQLRDSVTSQFARMEIAEEELARAPETRTGFVDLCPPSILRTLSDRLYRAHCRELVERDGERVSAPTSAELCAVMSANSLIQPLNQAASWVFWKHFDRVLPGVMEEPYADDYDRGELGREIETQAIRRVPAR